MSRSLANLEINAVAQAGSILTQPRVYRTAHALRIWVDTASVEEAPEFPTRVIDALRTPLESGTVTLGRSEVQARYPARFQLVMASNPCPCGQAATPGAHCSCPPQAVRRYGRGSPDP